MRQILFATMTCLAASAVSAAPVIVTNTQSGFIKEWCVLGPFPGTTLPTAESNGATRSGFNTDYLTSIGGEAKAVLSPAQKVDGLTCRRIKANAAGTVDLAAAYGDKANSTAYAFVQIDSPTDQKLMCFFGSDDWAKVWLNGELITDKWQGEGRPLNPKEELLTLKLKQGLNNLLVKVDQSTGPWALSMRKVTQKDIDKMDKEAVKLQRLRAVMGMQLSLDRAVFDKTGFPGVNWEKPELLELLYGKINTKPARWFNSQLEEVTKPTVTGRYMVYLEAELPDGSLLRRSSTAVCVDPSWHPWMGPEPYQVQAPPIKGIILPDGAWSGYQTEINKTLGQHTAEEIFFKPFGAVMLAGLMEAKPSASGAIGQLDWFTTMDQDKQLALKLKILGAEGKYPGMKPPAELAVPAPELVSSTPQEARMDPACIEQIRKAGQQWWDATKIPFTVVAARDNKVFYAEPFGTDASGKPLDMDAKLPLASLTKMHAGLLLGEFIEQGLISLDDPIGKYLPDFPTTGDKCITVRMAVNHTTGLEGHGEWGGMNNPWLDNSIRNGLSQLKPGRVAIYNGMGFDLAGKIMEIVGQKSIFRLFHEYLFGPMGHQNVSIEDLGYGINCSSMELARVGQMVMNKGSYGHMRFMSPETLQKLMPIHVKQIEPKLDTDWVYGVGFTYMPDIPDNAKTDAKGNKLPILSDQTIAHGAATGAILRIDPVNNLIISVCRPEPGPDYEKYKNALIQAIADGMK